MTARHRPNPLIYFKNKRVLITGGAGALGQELTKKFLEYGCQVVVWDNDITQLQQLQNSQNSHYSKSLKCITVDLCNLDDIVKAISLTIDNKNITGVDILINNAGIVCGDSLLDTDINKVNKLMIINATSHLATIQGFVPQMIQMGQGHIVTVASVMGVFGAVKLGPYCASKSAAIMLAECLRLELKDYPDIKIHTIMPWHINTPMFRGLKFPFITRKLIPTLETTQVADNIINAILKKETITMIPQRLKLVLISRAILPLWLYDYIGMKLGSKAAMNNFQGRKN